MSELVCFIAGTRTAYSQAELSFDLEQLAHSFRLSLPWQSVTEPLPVEFWLDRQRIFLGQIDEVSDEVGGSSHTLSLSGRSKSANLIDSTITMDARYDQTLEKLMRDIIKPFGLGVRSEVDESPQMLIEEFQINAESPLDNLAQLAKERGLVLIERNGVVVLEPPAKHRLSNVAVQVGVNVESLSLTRNFSKQYYHTEVRGQWSDVHAVVTNEAINPQRQRVIVSDQLQSAQACLTRAQYERDLSTANSLSASTTIAGLHADLTGSAINCTIPVISPKQGMREDLLIKSLSLSVSDTQAQTSLTFCRPFKEQYV